MPIRHSEHSSRVPTICIQYVLWYTVIVGGAKRGVIKSKESPHIWDKCYTRIERKTIIFYFAEGTQHHPRECSMHEMRAIKLFFVCDLEHFYVSFAWWKFSFRAGVHSPKSRTTATPRSPYNQCTLRIARKCERFSLLLPFFSFRFWVRLLFIPVTL